MYLYANIFGRWVRVREVYGYHEDEQGYLFDANVGGVHCVDIDIRDTEIRPAL